MGEFDPAARSSVMSLSCAAPVPATADRPPRGPGGARLPRSPRPCRDPTTMPAGTAAPFGLCRIRFGGWAMTMLGRLVIIAMRLGVSKDRGFWPSSGRSPSASSSRSTRFVGELLAERHPHSKAVAALIPLDLGDALGRAVASTPSVLRRVARGTRAPLCTRARCHPPVCGHISGGQVASNRRSARPRPAASGTSPRRRYPSRRTARSSFSNESV